MHTHYDNLKVSRDAPFEVIRAAYKSLSQKYHPDRHADGDEANRIMRLINAAYEVLSDPVKREEHDRWIATQEKLEAQRGRRPAAARPGTAAGTAAGTAPRPQAPPRPQAQPQQPSQAQSARERARKAEAEKAARAEKEREKAREKAREQEKERQRERERREHEAEQQRRAERADRDRRERERADERESRNRRREERPMREDGFQPARLSGRSWSLIVYSLAATAILVLLSDWVPGASIETPAANAATDPAPAVTAAAAPPPSPPSPAAIASSIISTREETRYIRPTLTPKGEPWPERSGYVPGYPVLNTDGLSMVTIDNTRNKFDVFLKLVSMDNTRPLPVRTSYVRSGTSFTMENIAPGSYDVRYRSLDTGEIFRSERFDLKEIQEATGTSFAKNILTLYSVEGKARNVSIPEREFP